MSKLSKVLVAVGAIAGVVVVAIVLSRRPGKGPESDLQVSVSEPTSAATVETNRSSFFIKRARQHPLKARPVTGRWGSRPPRPILSLPGRTR